MSVTWTKPGRSLRGLAAAVASLSLVPAALAQRAPLIEDLVAANRILAQYGVLDGFGHVSFRHPNNPQRFFISRSLAPELVTEADIVELDLDAERVDPEAASSYRERFIHSEIYKNRPDVNAVVHNHSPRVISFGIGEIPLQPVNHNAAFILDGVPVFDYRELGIDKGVLIDTPARGGALAEALANSGTVLMRNHGVTVVGSTLSMVVGRSIYLEQNAEIQTQAILRGGRIHYLELEGDVRSEFINANYDRSWQLWKRNAMTGHD